MITLDDGHRYALDCLSVDSERRTLGRQPLTFVKRIGEKYPGNAAPGYEGTNCQEVLRALIERCIYLNGQTQCAETEAVIGLLRTAVLLFEVRAARIHGRTLRLSEISTIEAFQPCVTCGHIGCHQHDKGAA